MILNKRNITNLGKMTLLLIILFASTIQNAQAQSTEIYITDGHISETRIFRNSVVDIYATIVNLGNKSFDVISIVANFTNVAGSSKFNEEYSAPIDPTNRTLKAGQSFTATLKAKIINPESTYNVSIHFVAQDVYSEGDGTGIGPLPKIFPLAENISVYVVDLGNTSGVVLGIGLTFAGMVGVVILFIFYSWIKEKIKGKKH